MSQKCRQAINGTVTTVNNEKHTLILSEYDKTHKNKTDCGENHTRVTRTFSGVFSDELTDNPYKKNLNKLALQVTA